MVGFAHVVMHVALCSSMMNAGPNASIPLKVHLADGTGRQNVDNSFTIPRGNGTQGTIEFDVPRGTFRVTIVSPKYQCSALDYLAFISEHNRTVSETLVNGRAPDIRPVLMLGTAPQSFLYVQPTFVLLPKETVCNGPVGDPLPAKINVTNTDQDAYYVQLFSDPSIEAAAPVVVAAQLATSTGEYHYIRLKVPFPEPWAGFPDTFQFNISEDTIDWISQQPIDTLLCPKMSRTSVG